MPFRQPGASPALLAPSRAADHGRHRPHLPRGNRARCTRCRGWPIPPRGGHASDDPLGADSIRALVRRRAAAVDGIAGRIGGHSLRVGSARELAADGASVAELQQAGGWKSPTTPGVYIRREAAARGPVARRRYKVGA